MVARAPGRLGAVRLRYAMIAAYVRVSSPGQDLSMQREAIGRVCRARGERIDLWFSEKRGGAGVREQLEALRLAVRHGEVSKVYVWRLDRLSRNGILEVLNLVHEFRKHGCQLESINDGFSLEGPAADVVLAVFAWVAEMERSAIRARLLEARTALEAAGGRWGRPQRVDRTTHERMLKLRSQGQSVREIAIALKVPRSTVHKHLAVPSQYYPPRVATAS